MIGYYHHFGDYARDTQDLSIYEHAAYLNLIHWYYLNERPIPLDWHEIGGVCRTKTKRERMVTTSLLVRYFVLKDDGWHHKRIDKELRKHGDSGPKREQRILNERARQARHRDWRSKAFETLRKAGCVMAWNATAQDLQDMLHRLGLKVCEGQENLESPAPATAPVTAPATAQTDCNEESEVTRDVAAKHPFPLSLNPIPSRVTRDGRRDISVNETAPATPAPAVRVCIELRKLGLTSAQSQDPRLQAALAEGASLDDFRSAAVQALAIKATNPWAYLLATVRGRLKHAQEGPKSGRGATNGELVRGLVPGIALDAPRPDFLEVLDVDARRLD